MNLKTIESRNITLEIGDINKKDENGIVRKYSVTYTSVDWPDSLHTTITADIVHSPESNSYWERMQGLMNCTAIGTEPVPVSSLLQSINITNLIPYTRYEFTITGCTQLAGCAVHGATVDGITLEGTVVIYRTLPDIPECNTNITSVQNISSTSVHVEWSHLTHYCKHGTLERYHIIWLDADVHSNLTSNSSLIFDNNTTLPNVTYTQGNNTILHGLKKYWKYAVFVIFENQVGTGPASDWIWFMTDEDGTA